MATTTNTAGTHSGTPNTDDMAFIDPAWTIGVTPNGVHFRSAAEHVVALYEFASGIVWSIYDCSDGKADGGQYRWPYSLEQAYTLAYSIFRHDGVTDAAMLRLVEEVKFLTT